MYCKQFSISVHGWKSRTKGSCFISNSETKSPLFPGKSDIIVVYHADFEISWRQFVGQLVSANHPTDFCSYFWISSQVVAVELKLLKFKSIWNFKIDEWCLCWGRGGGLFNCIVNYNFINCSLSTTQIM